MSVKRYSTGGGAGEPGGGGYAVSGEGDIHVVEGIAVLCAIELRDISHRIILETLLKDLVRWKQYPQVVGCNLKEIPSI